MILTPISRQKAHLIGSQYVEMNLKSPCHRSSWSNQWNDAEGIKPVVKAFSFSDSAFT